MNALVKKAMKLSPCRKDQQFPVSLDDRMALAICWLTGKLTPKQIMHALGMASQTSMYGIIAIGLREGYRS